MVLSLFILTSLSANPESDISGIIQDFDHAMSWMDNGEVACSYTVETHSLLSNLDGQKEEITVMVQIVSSDGAGNSDVHVEKAFVNDVDKTRKFQKKQEKEEEEPFSLIMPGVEHQDKFNYRTTQLEDGILRIDFSPKQESLALEGIMEGHLLWDMEKGLPLYLSTQCVTFPKMVSDLKMDFSFEEEQGHIIPHEMVISGIGGVLFIQKRFTTTMIIRDFILN